MKKMSLRIERRLNKLYKNASRLPITESSKLVIMSDIHRGDASNADAFAKNQNIMHYALMKYYDAGFTYIELGDGDELWENRHFEDIADAHGNIFEQLSQFYHSGQLIMIFGNHDMCKRSAKWRANHMNYYIRKNTKLPLFYGIYVHEAIVLEMDGCERGILLLHGHQADTFNYTFWRLGRFLVRYVWRPLSLIGIQDPMSAQKNHKKKKKVETILSAWSTKYATPIIAGHTHRSVFPEDLSEPLYYNGGCAVHPRCITAIEIECGNIILVKWHVVINEEGTLNARRHELTEPKCLCSSFVNNPVHVQ